jgi:uncharacterized protein YjlB
MNASASNGLHGRPVRADPVMPSAWHFADDGAIPNHPTLPVLLYPQALAPGDADPALLAEAILARNHWPPAWRNGIYSFAHYHSTAHEVLAICRGIAKVRLGGATGQQFVLEAGDVVVLPAGTGHQNLGASADLLVVGGYPPGQRCDLLKGAPADRPQALINIQNVPLPTSDPVHGAAGPLLAAWGVRPG